ncbi:MAG: hypothetical protein COT17_06800 [Elusimicrobia bacterium CG08_land_8_20_14_0_20_51_18]|nr:MAG: hypothetical protein COT17_06800 [Elusimicrobia bacterium CG08_land_8_20_14_0_20_51_18]
MDLMSLVGFSLGAFVILWGVISSGIGMLFINSHGIVLVVGGTLAATIINTSYSAFMSGLKGFVKILRKDTLPDVADCIKTLVSLSNTAQKEGGIMALQNVDPNFARGFLKRAVTVAMISGELREVRNILEEEIRRSRLNFQEDSNFYRTAGVLSPMFGLIGTLFGIIQTLSNLSDPQLIAKSMAVAITSAFYGISFSNLIFIPVANKIRLLAINETLIFQLVLEGVVDIMSGKPSHLVEMHLKGYIVSERK